MGRFVPSPTVLTDLQVDGTTMVVDESNHRLGIGTATPQAALDVAGDIFPSADATHDLGSSSKRWDNIFTNDLHLANDRGDYTIIEEEEYLSIRNNKSGKLYKFVLEEIPED